MTTTADTDDPATLSQHLEGAVVKLQNGLISMDKGCAALLLNVVPLCRAVARVCHDAAQLVHAQHHTPTSKSMFRATYDIACALRGLVYLMDLACAAQCRKGFEFAKSSEAAASSAAAAASVAASLVAKGTKEVPIDKTLSAQDAVACLRRLAAAASALRCGCGGRAGGSHHLGHDETVQTDAGVELTLEPDERSQKPSSEVQIGATHPPDRPASASTSTSIARSSGDGGRLPRAASSNPGDKETRIGTSDADGLEPRAGAELAARLHGALGADGAEVAARELLAAEAAEARCLRAREPANGCGVAQDQPVVFPWVSLQQGDQALLDLLQVHVRLALNGALRATGGLDCSCSGSADEASLLKPEALASLGGTAAILRHHFLHDLPAETLLQVAKSAPGGAGLGALGGRGGARAAVSAPGAVGLLGLGGRSAMAPAGLTSPEHCIPVLLSRAVLLLTEQAAFLLSQDAEDGSQRAHRGLPTQVAAATTTLQVLEEVVIALAEWTDSLRASWCRLLDGEDGRFMGGGSAAQRGHAVARQGDPRPVPWCDGHSTAAAAVLDQTASAAFCKAGATIRLVQARDRCGPGSMWLAGTGPALEAAVRGRGRSLAPTELPGSSAPALVVPAGAKEAVVRAHDRRLVYPPALPSAAATGADFGLDRPQVSFGAMATLSAELWARRPLDGGKVAAMAGASAAVSAERLLAVANGCELLPSKSVDPSKTVAAAVGATVAACLRLLQSASRVPTATRQAPVAAVERSGIHGVRVPTWISLGVDLLAGTALVLLRAKQADPVESNEGSLSCAPLSLAALVAFTLPSAVSGASSEAMPTPSMVRLGMHCVATDQSSGLSQQAWAEYLAAADPASLGFARQQRDLLRCGSMLAYLVHSTPFRDGSISTLRAGETAVAHAMRSCLLGPVLGSTVGSGDSDLSPEHLLPAALQCFEAGSASVSSILRTRLHDSSHVERENATAWAGGAIGAGLAAIAGAGCNADRKSIGQRFAVSFVQLRDAERPSAAMVLLRESMHLVGLAANGELQQECSHITTQVQTAAQFLLHASPDLTLMFFDIRYEGGMSVGSPSPEALLSILRSCCEPAVGDQEAASGGTNSQQMAILRTMCSSPAIVNSARAALMEPLLQVSFSDAAPADLSELVRLLDAVLVGNGPTAAPAGAVLPFSIRTDEGRELSWSQPPEDHAGVCQREYGSTDDLLADAQLLFSGSSKVRIGAAKRLAPELGLDSPEVGPVGSTAGLGASSDPIADIATQIRRAHRLESTANGLGSDCSSSRVRSMLRKLKGLVELSLPVSTAGGREGRYGSVAEAAWRQLPVELGRIIAVCTPSLGSDELAAVSDFLRTALRACVGRGTQAVLDAVWASRQQHGYLELSDKDSALLLHSMRCVLRILEWRARMQWHEGRDSESGSLENAPDAPITVPFDAFLLCLRLVLAARRGAPSDTQYDARLSHNRLDQARQLAVRGLALTAFASEMCHGPATEAYRSTAGLLRQYPNLRVWLPPWIIESCSGSKAVVESDRGGRHGYMRFVSHTSHGVPARAQSLEILALSSPVNGLLAPGDSCCAPEAAAALFRWMTSAAVCLGRAPWANSPRSRSIDPALPDAFIGRCNRALLQHVSGLEGSSKDSRWTIWAEQLQAWRYWERLLHSTCLAPDSAALAFRDGVNPGVNTFLRELGNEFGSMDIGKESRPTSVTGSSFRQLEDDSIARAYTLQQSPYRTLLRLQVDPLGRGGRGSVWMQRLEALGSVWQLQRDTLGTDKRLGVRAKRQSMQMSRPGCSGSVAAVGDWISPAELHSPSIGGIVGILPLGDVDSLADDATDATRHGPMIALHQAAMLLLDRKVVNHDAGAAICVVKLAMCGLGRPDWGNESGALLPSCDWTHATIRNALHLASKVAGAACAGAVDDISVPKAALRLSCAIAGRFRANGLFERSSLLHAALQLLSSVADCSPAPPDFVSGQTNLTWLARSLDERRPCVREQALKLVGQAFGCHKVRLNSVKARAEETDSNSVSPAPLQFKFLHLVARVASSSFELLQARALAFRALVDFGWREIDPKCASAGAPRSFTRDEGLGMQWRAAVVAGNVPLAARRLLRSISSVRHRGAQLPAGALAAEEAVLWLFGLLQQIDAPEAGENVAAAHDARDAILEVAAAMQCMGLKEHAVAGAWALHAGIQRLQQVKAPALELSSVWAAVVKATHEAVVNWYHLAPEVAADERRLLVGQILCASLGQAVVALETASVGASSTTPVKMDAGSCLLAAACALQYMSQKSLSECRHRCLAVHPLWMVAGMESRWLSNDPTLVNAPLNAAVSVVRGLASGVLEGASTSRCFEGATSLARTLGAQWLRVVESCDLDTEQLGQQKESVVLVELLHCRQTARGAQAGLVDSRPSGIDFARRLCVCLHQLSKEVTLSAGASQAGQRSAIAALSEALLVCEATLGGAPILSGAAQKCDTRAMCTVEADPSTWLPHGDLDTTCELPMEVGDAGADDSGLSEAQAETRADQLAQRAKFERQDPGGGQCVGKQLVLAMCPETYSQRLAAPGHTLARSHVHVRRSRAACLAAPCMFQEALWACSRSSVDTLEATIRCWRCLAALGNTCMERCGDPGGQALAAGSRLLAQAVPAAAFRWMLAQLALTMRRAIAEVAGREGARRVSLQLLRAQGVAVAATVRACRARCLDLVRAGLADGSGAKGSPFLPQACRELWECASAHRGGRRSHKGAWGRPVLSVFVTCVQAWVRVAEASAQWALGAEALVSRPIAAGAGRRGGDLRDSPATLLMSLARFGARGEAAGTAVGRHQGKAMPGGKHVYQDKCGPKESQAQVDLWLGAAGDAETRSACNHALRAILRARRPGATLRRTQALSCDGYSVIASGDEQLS